MLKLDRSKSFGTIYGHDFAQYEQNGRLYNGAEMLIENPSDNEEAELVGQEVVTDGTPAVEFIKKSLSGGPVAQAAIYRDAQEQKLNWAVVKSEAADIGVRIEIIKGKPIWSLK